MNLDAKWSVPFRVPRVPSRAVKRPVDQKTDTDVRFSFPSSVAVGYSTVRKQKQPGGSLQGLRQGFRARPGQARARDLGIIHARAGSISLA